MQAVAANPATLPSCGGCAALEHPATPTVELLTGATVCTSCPAWLEETRERQKEAYAILAMSWKEDRQAHLAKVQAERGTLARERLEAVVLSTWKARREHGTKGRE
jgi:hypothetical protein